MKREENHRFAAPEMARQFAARYFAALKRDDLSRLVLAGDGDDFEEVQAAREVLAGHADRLARYELALTQYAEADFWDDATPGGALAGHDGGEMARNVLAGRPAVFHRD
jgi:hypothetical protein